VYFSMKQNPSFMRVVYLRSTAAPEALGMLMEREIHALDADMPIADAKPLRQLVEGGAGFLLFHVGTVQAGAMGLLGLVLAVVGVYGVVSYGASLRTREMGIRIALGAEPRIVRGLVLRQGTVLVVIGIACGLSLAAAVTRSSSWWAPSTCRRSPGSRRCSPRSRCSPVICPRDARCAWTR
jgi:hypothetical protein